MLFHITDNILSILPKNFVVIADSGGDPYCKDLIDIQGSIYTSMHGTGQWEFEKFSDSFIDLLIKIIA